MNINSLFPSIVNAIERPDIEIVEIQKEQVFDCKHSDEDWYAVRTKMLFSFGSDYTPVVIQWCKKCKAHEIITCEEYSNRRSENGK